MIAQQKDVPAVDLLFSDRLLAGETISKHVIPVKARIHKINYLQVKIVSSQ